MPLFSKDEEQIYFIHIPRTAGRFIWELFVNNEFDPKFDEPTVDHSSGLIVRSHLHYPNYNYYFGVFHVPHFTVVRNPIDKFWSSLDLVYKMHSPKNFFKNLEDKSWFFDYIDYERSIDSYHNNWFMPQCDFVSNKTRVYKYEDGIDDNFCTWINSNFLINLKNIEVNYDKLNEEIKYAKKYEITEKIKSNIMEYYINDFKKFDY